MGRVEPHGVDIRRLRLLVAVCDHGSISRAAAAVGMAQPALTRQLQLLEQDIGLDLLSRSGRGAIPTEPGRYLVDNARMHLAALDEVVEQLRARYQGCAGEVTLGICPTITPLFLADLQGTLRARHPALKLSVIEAYSGDLQSLVQCGRIDLALSYRPTRAQGLKWQDLLSEPLVLVRRSCSDAGPGISLDQLADLDMILPGRIHQLRQLIDRVCRRRGLRLEPALELNSLEAVKAALDDPGANFVTILPFHSVVADATGGRFMVQWFDDPAMTRTIALVQPDDPQRQSSPDVLLECIRAQARFLKESISTVS